MRSTTTVVASKEDQSLMMNQSAVMSVFFCAIQSDGRWYRAEVIENENHPDIVVSRLDKDLFGMVHAGQIRRLPEELKEMPGALLYCSLSGVYPASASSGWSPKVTHLNFLNYYSIYICI